MISVEAQIVSLLEQISGSNVLFEKEFDMLKHIDFYRLSWAMFALAVGTSVLIALLQVWITPVESRWSITTIVGVVFAIVGWFGAVPALQKKMEDQWVAGNERINQIISTFVTQEVIDAELRRHAKPFGDACSLQVSLRGTETAEIQIDRVKALVGETKSAFWAAHQLACDMEQFVMFAKVDNYLPQKTAEPASSES